MIAFNDEMLALVTAVSFIEERGLTINTHRDYLGDYSVILTFIGGGTTLQKRAENASLSVAIIAAVEGFKAASRGIDTRPALTHERAASPLSDF